MEFLTPDEAKVVADIKARCDALSSPPWAESIERSTGLQGVDAILKRLYARRIVDVAKPRRPRSRRRWVLVEGVEYRGVGASGSVQDGHDCGSEDDRRYSGSGVAGRDIGRESGQGPNPGRAQESDAGKTHEHREVKLA